MEAVCKMLALSVQGLPKCMHVADADGVSEVAAFRGDRANNCKGKTDLQTANSNPQASLRGTQIPLRFRMEGLGFWVYLRNLKNQKAKSLQHQIPQTTFLRNPSRKPLTWVEAKPPAVGKGRFYSRNTRWNDEFEV